MPFGLCKSPATFQRLAECCLGELKSRDYFEDINTISSIDEEHVERLKAVSILLDQHNLKLRKFDTCDQKIGSKDECNKLN